MEARSYGTRSETVKTRKARQYALFEGIPQPSWCVLACGSPDLVKFPMTEPNDPLTYPPAAVPSEVGATSGAGTVQKGPFAGTPAENFPEGEAGLVMPAAQKTGAWSEPP